MSPGESRREDTDMWDWQHETEARHSDAYGAGLRDGEAARHAGRPAGSCDPADWDERYADRYRAGWEHAYATEEES